MCSNCQSLNEWHTVVGRFAICQGCGETLVLSADGSTRKAVGADVDQLHPDDLKTLRSGLGAWRRSQRPDRFPDTPKPLPERIH